ncbi:MerR family transcriptional regulator [Bosea sp. R86505]|uniref:MerR family transcriptional regulator n=1 Tax=Bosea sp. R86505 TaxID=3101710 RepID=UPI00367018A3
MAYSIRQIADEFGISLRTLRFYEERGLLSPARLPKSPLQFNRIYDDTDKQRLADVIRYRKMGFTITEILQGNPTRKQIKEQIQLLFEKTNELDEAIILLKSELMSLK